LEKFFPSIEFLQTSFSYWKENQEVNFLEPRDELPVRVVLVPKTLKTPRIIAIEPTAMQYTQQAIMECLLDSLNLKPDSFADFSHIDGMLGFSDQETNQNLAQLGSSSLSLATLDLSEASDRVSNQLVRLLFGRHPHLHGAVDACRSRKADVPGHGVIRLAKFASMGSALTFPIEAMVFLTIIFIGIERELNTQLTRRDVKSLKGSVRVYGDDLIIPVPFVRSVVSALEDFGLQVNRSKSFWNGKFRESCGKEYYDGSDVSVVRFRREFPTHRRHVQEIISLVSFRNQIYEAGYWTTCKWLDTKIRRLLKYFPVVLSASPVLGRHSFLGYQAQRIDEHLQSPQVRGWCVSSTPPSDILDGTGALLKFFLKRGSLPSADRRHLERAGRPHAVGIKLRWASAV
jgi:hypothetical protein